jgi:hypothetical protein
MNRLGLTDSSERDREREREREERSGEVVKDTTFRVRKEESTFPVLKVA